MPAVLDWLNSVAFSGLGESVTVVQLFAFAAVAVSVAAATRRFAWNWPVGILGHLLLLAALLGGGLLASAAVQLVFVVIAGYGWWAWRRRARSVSSGASADGASAEEGWVRRATGRQLAYGVVFTAIGTVVVAYALAMDSSSSWKGAFVLAVSVLATWAQSRRLVESWWVWMVAYATACGIAAASAQWVSALVFAVLLALSVAGLRSWTRVLRASRAAQPDVVVPERESLPV